MMMICPVLQLSRMEAGKLGDGGEFSLLPLGSNILMRCARGDCLSSEEHDELKRRKNEEREGREKERERERV